MQHAAALGQGSSGEYQFTNTWFEMSAKGIWDALIPQVNPTRILEIGSYEGKSCCYVIEKLAQAKPIEIHCVDTWEGGEEHQKKNENMSDVEARFLHNVAVAKQRVQHPVELVVHKGYSDQCLYQLLAAGKAGYFDFIYVDGSHQAADVLCDAVLSFRLLKKGGVIAFDDYIGAEEFSYGKDLFLCPKMAIDAFVNIYFRKLTVLNAPLYQLYVQKTAD